jgi:N6-adenosine-specific RNA methylase IME4
MPARRIGKKAMTNAQKQKRYRENKKPNSTTSKRRRRDQREQTLATKTLAASAALGSKLYGVLYIDPPWQEMAADCDSWLNKSADNHYPTMTVDELAAITPPAAPDCVLFLWTFTSQLDAAVDLIRRWGFTYKASCVWDKGNADGTGRMGIGQWFRYEHELLLVATRGDIPAPAPGTQSRSVIRATRGRHSEKPEAVAAMIAEYYPSLPKLEMFARKPRNGWDSWGNEAT